MLSEGAAARVPQGAGNPAALVRSGNYGALLAAMSSSALPISLKSVAIAFTTE
jgi:hypothetical protein